MSVGYLIWDCFTEEKIKILQPIESKRKRLVWHVTESLLPTSWSEERELSRIFFFLHKVNKRAKKGFTSLQLHYIKENTQTCQAIGGNSAVLTSNDWKKSIVWLDSSVNGPQENLTTQQVFGTLTSHFKTYTDEKECERYIDHRWDR